MNTVVDSVGYAAAGGGIMMTAMEAIGIHSNEVLHTVASLGGILFLAYKIYNLVLDARMKKEQIKKLKEQRNEK